MLTNISRVLKISIFILFLAPNAMADDVQVSTYMSSPNGVYKDLRVRNALEVKNNAIHMYGELQVRDNDNLASPQGGNLSVYSFNGASAEMDNESGTRRWVTADANGVNGSWDAVPLLSQYADNFAFNSTSWAIRSKSAVGYSNPNDLPNSAAYQITHANDDINNRNNGFAGVTGTPGVDQRHITLHLDGAPLRFLVDPETNAPIAGQVIIRGEANPVVSLPAGHTARVVVGKASDASTNVASQSLTVPSIRSAKYDISYLDKQGYDEILGKLKNLDVVTFRYKGDSPDAKKSLGFIAEEAPDEMTDNSKKVIRINDAMGFLMASTKALQEENVELKKRIEDLKK